MIPYARHSINERDIELVVQALRSSTISQGHWIEEFERRFADRVNAKYAVAFSSGTAGLHAAILACGIRPGMRVATSPLTFVATANVIRYAGAEVELVDIDAETLNMDLAMMGSDFDGVIAVHYAGLPLRLSELRARPRVIIEDAAHALGAMTPDGPVGNCRWSDVCCFSFHPAKAMTTGEGGMATQCQGLKPFRWV